MAQQTPHSPDLSERLLLILILLCAGMIVAEMARNVMAVSGR